jgi:hypothetical protein
MLGAAFLTEERIMNILAPRQRTEDEKVELFKTLSEEGYTNAAVGLWTDILFFTLERSVSSKTPDTTAAPPAAEIPIPPLPEATRQFLKELGEAQVLSDMRAVQRIVRFLYDKVVESPRVLSEKRGVPPETQRLSGEEVMQDFFSRAALGPLALMADACRRELEGGWLKHRYPGSCVPQFKAMMREAFCNIDAIMERYAFLKDDGSSLKEAPTGNRGFLTGESDPWRRESNSTKS